MEVIKKAYHIQVYEILKEQIIRGELLPGERILINKVSEQLNVSGSPVREALRILEQDELVISNSSGFAVNPMDFNDMKQLYECRMALEPFAARLATKNIGDKDLDRLKYLIKEAKKSHELEEYEQVIKYNTEFHDIIVQNCDNQKLQNMIKKTRLLIILARRAEIESFKRKKDYLAEHDEILEALISRNGEEAERVLRRHTIHDLEFYTSVYKENNQAK
jgi:DNA-binding GntR family transcriptional regulator